jgi:hypothetical protein
MVISASATSRYELSAALLVLRQGLIEPRLGRLVIALDALPVEQRLKQPRAHRPDHRVALQDISKIAADGAERARQADRRVEQRLGRADVRIRCDQKPLGLEDVGTPFEQRRRHSHGNRGWHVLFIQRAARARSRRAAGPPAR